MAYGFGTTTDVATSSSGTTQTLSVTYSLHDRAFVYISFGTDSVITATLSDGTNTYAQVKKLTDGSNTETGTTFECLDCAAGSFTITCTLGSSEPYRSICCTNYNGLDNAAANANNGANNNNPGSGADALTSGTATPGAQPAIVFGVAMDTSGSETSISAGTGFTNRGTMANTETAIGVKTRVEDKRVTSLSAVAATFTASPGTTRFFSHVIIVAESGGGGGGTTVMAGRISLLGAGL